MSFGIGGGLTPWVKGLLIANVIAFLFQNAVPGLTQQMQFVPGSSSRCSPSKKS